MYGFTEILPGQITTDKIVSGDGNSYFDLVNNKFNIGDGNTSLSWNVVDGLLQILNATLEVKNSSDEIVSKIYGNDGTAMFGKFAHTFNPDGSFNLANGNFLYDLINGLSVIGKIKTSSTGSSIVIDPTTNDIKMINSGGEEIFVLNFNVETYGGVEYLAPKMILNHWVGGVKLYWYELNGYECRFYDNNDNQAYIRPNAMGCFKTDNSWGLGVTFDYLNNNLNLSMRGLPTNPSGLSTGRVYRDTNTNHLLIVP
jgi:hypothetical protein